MVMRSAGLWSLSAALANRRPDVAHLLTTRLALQWGRLACLPRYRTHIERTATDVNQPILRTTERACAKEHRRLRRAARTLAFLT